MARCARCGRQTEDAAAPCVGCGGAGKQDSAKQSVPAARVSADYLRPFAPEGTQFASLRSEHEPTHWARPAGQGDQGGWHLTPPSGQRPDFSPLPYRSPPSALSVARPRPDARHEQSGAAAEPFRQVPCDGTGAPRTGTRAPGSPRSGRWLPVAAALVIILLCAVAVAVMLGRHGQHAAASAERSRQPASTYPRPASTGRLLSLAPGVTGGPHAVAVERFVTRYFEAINDHDYSAYRLLFSRSLRGGLSAAQFRTGYGSSKDSRATLRSISSGRGGELDAVVTFTSHQRPARSPTRSSCTTWTISLYLIRQGRAYVLVSPPAGYQATFVNC